MFSPSSGPNGLGARQMPARRIPARRIPARRIPAQRMPRATDARAATLPATPASRAVLDLWVRRPIGSIRTLPAPSRPTIAASGYAMSSSEVGPTAATRHGTQRFARLGHATSKDLSRQTPAAPGMRCSKPLRRLAQPKRKTDDRDRGPWRKRRSSRTRPANLEEQAKSRNLADDDRNGLVDDVRSDRGLHRSEPWSRGPPPATPIRSKPCSSTGLNRS